MNKLQELASKWFKQTQCRLGYHQTELVIDKETVMRFPSVDYYQKCKNCEYARRAVVIG